jgi:hypothetical protein
MRTRNLMLTATLTVAVVGLFATVLTTSLLPGSAAAGHIAAGHHHGTAGRGHWGCGQLDDRATRLVSAYVSITLDLDDAQEAALAPVIEIAERWHEEAASICQDSGITTAPAALVELDRVLATTRTALDELRPAFDAFYAALTADQQERLNSWINEHHDSRT